MYDDFPNGKATIWTWNVNGLNAGITKGTLKTYLESAQPDILCLNELKIDQETFVSENFISEVIP